MGNYQLRFRAREIVPCKCEGHSSGPAPTLPVVRAGEAETGRTLGLAASTEGGNQRSCLKQQVAIHLTKTHYQLLVARSYTYMCTRICMYMNIYILRKLKLSESLLAQNEMITGKPGV